MPYRDCQYCGGTGVYEWTDTGYGPDIDYSDPCKFCAASGTVKIEIPLRLYKRFRVDTKEQLRAILRHKEEYIKDLPDIIRGHEKEIEILKKYLKK